MKKPLTVFCVLAILASTGCKTGYNKRYTTDTDKVDAPDCAQTPVTPNLISDGESVFNLIASLSCNDATQDGALMGQSLGFGNAIAGSGIASYEALMDPFGTRKPTIASVEYEFDKIYSDAELAEANAVLKTHWDAGGIVMISWTPGNPWSEESACADDQSTNNGNPAQPDRLSYCDDVDLVALYDDNGTMRADWEEQLDHIAVALQYFADAGIPVLWQPMPAPNSAGRYWWGVEASYDEADDNTADEAARYKALWQHMFTYLTEDKDLDNLIWVYSPAEGGDLPEDAPVDWAYPGDDFVDVVGAISQNDNLSIPDYKALNDIGKPLGLARYNPLPSEEGGSQAPFQDFDNRAYAERLEGSFENIAFWVTGHSYRFTVTNQNDEEEELQSNLALHDQLYWEDLAKRSYVLDLKTVKDNNLR